MVVVGDKWVWTFRRSLLDCLTLVLTSTKRVRKIGRVG
jgi:hypothetical protein